MGRSPVQKSQDECLKDVLAACDITLCFACWLYEHLTLCVCVCVCEDCCHLGCDCVVW